jgi:hypothetical protein
VEQDRLIAFEAVLPAISAFKRAFGRDLSADLVAELYAAREFNLELPSRRNESGSDAVDSAGLRYQVKFRSQGTQNVDVNNFDFDFIVLVNVDDDYALSGLWRMDRTTAEGIFIHRADYRKWQAAQARFKRAAVRIR